MVLKEGQTIEYRLPDYLIPCGTLPEDITVSFYTNGNMSIEKEVHKHRNKYYCTVSGDEMMTLSPGVVYLMMYIGEETFNIQSTIYVRGEVVPGDCEEMIDQKNEIIKEKEILIESLETDIAAKDETITVLTAQVATAYQEGKEAQAAEDEAKLEDITITGNGDYTADYGYKNIKVSVASEEIERLEAQIAALEEEKAQLEIALGGAQTMIAEAEARIAELDRQIADLNHTVGTLRAVIADYDDVIFQDWMVMKENGKPISFWPDAIIMENRDMNFRSFPDETYVYMQNDTGSTEEYPYGHPYPRKFKEEDLNKGGYLFIRGQYGSFNTYSSATNRPVWYPATITELNGYVRGTIHIYGITKLTGTLVIGDYDIYFHNPVPGDYSELVAYEGPFRIRIHVPSGKTYDYRNAFPESIRQYLDFIEDL